MPGGQAVEGAKRGTFFMVEPERLTVITDRAHPLYDERVEKPLTPRFLASLDFYGNKKSIIVRKVAPAEGGEEELVVVDGRRRTRGLLAVNELRAKRGDPLVLAKIEVVKADDRLAAALSTTLNEHHEEDDVLTKARKAQRYLGHFGTVEAVAEECFQVDAQTVEEWLKLLETAPAVQEAVQASRISASAGAALAGLPRAEQAQQLQELLAAGPVTVKVARAAARAKRGGRQGEDARPAPPRREVRLVLPALSGDLLAFATWVLDGGKPPAFVREALEAAKKKGKKRAGKVGAT